MAFLQAHQQTLRDAQSRKGQPPKERKSLDELILIHKKGRIANARPMPADGFKILSAFLCPPYAPSVRTLSSLKKTMVKDLLLETHHRGFYVLLRTVTPAFSMTGILAIVEDGNGDGVILNLYYHDKSIPAQDLLQEGQVLIVKEPYLNTTSDGNLGIRVDHLSDAIFLHVFDERVPEKRRHSSMADESVASTWRTRGNNFLFHLLFYQEESITG